MKNSNMFEMQQDNIDLTTRIRINLPMEVMVSVLPNRFIRMFEKIYKKSNKVSDFLMYLSEWWKEYEDSQEKIKEME